MIISLYAHSDLFYWYVIHLKSLAHANMEIILNFFFFEKSFARHVGSDF